MFPASQAPGARGGLSTPSLSPLPLDSPTCLLCHRRVTFVPTQALLRAVPSSLHSCPFSPSRALSGVTSTGGPRLPCLQSPPPGPSQQASVFPSGYHSPPSEVTPRACFLGVISLAFPLECELQGLRNPLVLLSPVCPAPAAAPRPEALTGSDWGTAQRLSVASGVLGSGPTGCLLAPLWGRDTSRPGTGFLL